MIRMPSPLAKTLDAELLATAKAARVSEHRMAELLARMGEGQLHREFGYAGVVDYAVERLGLSPKQASALLRIGKKLPELPVLAQAMAEGTVGWTKAREMVKVTTPGNEAAWVELARATNSRVLERAVRASDKGDAPPSAEAAEALPEQEQLTVRLTGQDAVLVRDTLQWIRATTPGSDDVDDGALLAMICQRTLFDADPETAPTPSRYRFVVEKGAGGAEAVIGEASCDAEVVDLGHGPTHGHVSHTIPPAIRRAVLHRDKHRCKVPGCRNRLWLELHHVVPRGTGGGNTLVNLLTSCTVHHGLLHDGTLQVWRGDGGGFWFRFPDERTVFVADEPRAPPPLTPAPVETRGAAPL